MSEEKRYDSFELDDNELDSVTGGSMDPRVYDRVRRAIDDKYPPSDPASNDMHMKAITELERLRNDTCTHYPDIVIEKRFEKKYGLRL